jgi:hypothetical protein
MTEQTMFDHDNVMEGFRAQNEQLIAAALRSQRELFEVIEQSLLAVAEAQEKMADASEAEWLSKLLRAQAGFTRDLVDASSKFAHELQET